MKTIQIKTFLFMKAKMTIAIVGVPVIIGEIVIHGIREKFEVSTQEQEEMMKAVEEAEEASEVEVEWMMDFEEEVVSVEEAEEEASVAEEVQVTIDSKAEMIEGDL